MELNYKDIDMKKAPQVHVTPLYVVANVLSRILAFTSRMDIHVDDEVKKLKGPYIVLANHASFTDFIGQIVAFKNRKLCRVVSIEEFYNIGEWVMRTLGCYPKRKFVPDITNVRHMINIIKKGKILCIYPEVRFSLAGINERLDKALGKLVKMTGVPLVFQKNYGNFIQSPQWCKRPKRKTKLVSEVKLLASKEDVERMSADEIQKLIEENFDYNEYEFQKNNKIKVISKDRMTNSHKILYKCPHCGKEYSTIGEGTKITCTNCHTTYEMDEYGELHNLNGETIFKSIPEWYLWEKAEVIKEVKEGKYHFEDDVILKRLFKPSVGYIPIGKMRFVHDYTGMHLRGNYSDGTPFAFDRPVELSRSVHIEYNSKDKKDKKNVGPAIDFASPTETYFGWLQTQKLALTKIHFATEALYDEFMEKRAGLSSLNKAN